MEYVIVGTVCFLVGVFATEIFAKRIANAMANEFSKVASKLKS